PGADAPNADAPNDDAPNADAPNADAPCIDASCTDVAADVDGLVDASSESSNNAAGSPGYICLCRNAPPTLESTMLLGANVDSTLSSISSPSSTDVGLVDRLVIRALAVCESVS